MKAKERKVKIKEYDRKVSQLSFIQQCHLAWRLEEKTEMSYGRACRTARCDEGDCTLLEAFKAGGNGDRSAKIHAGKVARFVPNDAQKAYLAASPFRLENPLQVEKMVHLGDYL